ncbi:MAG TPA: hypothetical protein VHA76_04065 [Solirubrobacterales bacterium]|nr:hypothetical protein [Solirubrobacterales bacterium]
MRIAFATCPAWPDGFPDDREAAALAGAEFRLWDDPAVDWEGYDRVVLRSVWDYTQRVEDFLAWCGRVGPERLRNTPELVAFNADKRYLGELGVPIVPTAFVGPDGRPPAFEGEVVVKPNVSSGARDTGRFPSERHDEALALIDAIRESGRVALVQPYLPGVDERGETAIVYLGGEVSHVLRKRPVLRAAGIAPLGADPHGPAAVMLEADLVLAGEATAAELALAAEVHERIAERFGVPLYARIDLVPGPDGEPVLIELEALDPCLYLDQAPGAAARLAAAITR